MKQNSRMNSNLFVLAFMTLMLASSHGALGESSSQDSLRSSKFFRRASTLRHFKLGTQPELLTLSSSPTWTPWVSSLASQNELGVSLFARSAVEGSSEKQLLVADPADPPQNKHFRPVSTAVQCTMVLSLVSIIFYTLLSVSRNVDELSGSFKPSLITQTLTAASRGTILAPMVCMLCVGCRMYILATTQGLGEPPKWADGCMYLATAGLCVQLLLVSVLPLTLVQKGAEEEADYDMTEGKAEKAKQAAQEAACAASATVGAGEQKESASENLGHVPFTEEPEAEKEAEEEVQDFDKVTGENNDAHPVLNNVKFQEGKDETLKPIFWGLQIVCILAIYGSVIGVITCIATFPAQTTKVSPSVICTVILTVLYFSVYLSLWAARSFIGAGEDGVNKALQAALSMSSVVRKAPMFAVLFLVSRMRALQLDPPLGLPPVWMSCCFYGITGLMYVETLAAAAVGFTGKQTKAYYGVYVFHCEGVACHAVQHICALVTYLMLFPIAIGVCLMTDQTGLFAKPGEPSPLATTELCTLILEFLYFGIALGQTAVFAMEDLLKQEGFRQLQDTFVAAGISVSFAPLLCILFVATRMRALQITQQRGAPPGWAQDCMLICVFGTFVQAACCLVMPIFIGSACKVDEDGNPDYDLRPMIGAYAVTCVKYVALMCLHGSLFAICASVFLMTPETANSSGRFIQGGQALFRALGGLLVVFALALLFSSAKVIGMAVKLAIESCDKVFLGVDITVKHAALGVCKGYVHIRDFKVHQPEEEIIYERNAQGLLVGTSTGKELVWREDYILKIKTILVKINLWRLVTTLGREFELENLSFVGIHANIEKPSANLRKQDSNIEYLLNHIESLGLMPPPGQEHPAAAAKAAEEAKAAAAAKPFSDAANGEAFIPRIILRKIALGDIGCGVSVEKVPIIGSLSFHPSIGVIEFQDIQQSIFNGREDLNASETIACIVKAIAKKIMGVVVVDIPKQLARTSSDVVTKALSNSMEGFLRMGKSMKDALTGGGGECSPCRAPIRDSLSRGFSFSPPRSPIASAMDWQTETPARCVVEVVDAASGSAEEAVQVPISSPSTALPAESRPSGRFSFWMSRSAGAAAEPVAQPVAEPAAEPVAGPPAEQVAEPPAEPAAEPAATLPVQQPAEELAAAEALAEKESGPQQPAEKYPFAAGSSSGTGKEAEVATSSLSTGLAAEPQPSGRFSLWMSRSTTPASAAQLPARVAEGSQDSAVAAAEPVGQPVAEPMAEPVAEPAVEPTAEHSAPLPVQQLAAELAAAGSSGGTGKEDQADEPPLLQRVDHRGQ